ncbi:MAG: L-aspartate oxidase [Candidatus Peregrinibacteria bacterium]|nr:L-aspartate oxidase [Candidatus Peregrinibacteria bacterium]
MTKETDFLIIGSGIAGLAAATYLGRLGKVTVITKGEAKNTNTYWAQGGVATVMLKDDSFESHIADTLAAGLGHCNEAAVRQVVFGGSKAIRFLESLGLKMDSEPMLEAGHSHPRIWRSSDFTGRDILEALLKGVQRDKNIEILDQTDAYELIVQDEGCIGAYVRPADGEPYPIVARATILATGGSGQLFGRTSNTLGSGGDGLALAVNAGLELADMEFMQFHPTALEKPDNGRHFLLSETLRGFGALVVNSAGQDFLKKLDDRGELAPRDLVARAIFLEQHEGPVYLDMRSLEANSVKQKFPNIFKALKGYGYDLTEDLIPITPVAHYACGGVVVDLKGATQLPGLHAVGEVAATGVHGANRLPSNSLLESLVFAQVLADSLEKRGSAGELKNVTLKTSEVPKVVTEDINQVKAYAKRLGKIMWENAGIIRTREGLDKAKREIVAIPARDYRIQHRQLVCYKIVEACLARPESLGTHYMSNEIA